MYAIQGNMKCYLFAVEGKHMRKKKNIKLIIILNPYAFISKTVMVSFIYFLFQMVMMISAADWLSLPKSLLWVQSK